MTNPSSNALVKKVDDLLPQTQCTQCGYSGCLPYATAIVENNAQHNRCPPGGSETILALSQLLHRPVEPLDTNCGQTIPRHIASIQPEHCIGCTLCIQACPVDAIVGTNKKRHAVIAALCTGCELCIPPCPVDCIDMVFLPEYSEWTGDHAHQARERMNTRKQRLTRQQQETQRRLEQKTPEKSSFINTNHNQSSPLAKKQDIIQAALQRARLKRQNDIQ